MVKPLKVIIFGPNLHKKRVTMGTILKTRNNFFTEITKPDHKLSKTFYFIKVYVLAELWMFFYLVWYFFAKKGHFQPSSCAEAILLSRVWLEDCLTKVKSSKIITFCYFWPNMGKNLVLIPSKTVFLANLVFKFYPGISITTTSCFQLYTSCKIWKKILLKCQFLCFFTI